MEFPSFVDTRVNGEVAPKPAIGRAAELSAGFDPSAAIRYFGGHGRVTMPDLPVIRRLRSCASSRWRHVQEGKGGDRAVFHSTCSRRIRKNGATIIFPALDFGRVRRVAVRARAGRLHQVIDKRTCHLALHSWNGRAGAPAEV